MRSRGSGQAAPRRPLAPVMAMLALLALLRAAAETDAGERWLAGQVVRLGRGDPLVPRAERADWRGLGTLVLVAPRWVSARGTTVLRADRLSVRPTLAPIRASAPLLAAAGPALPGGLRLAVDLPADGLVPWGGPALSSPLHIRGTVRLRGSRVEFETRATSDGPGDVEASGWYDRGPTPRFEASVRLNGIDPSSVLARLPSGRVHARVQLSGRPAFPPDASASGTVALQASSLRGVPVGPGSARFSVRGATLHVRDAEAALPGGRVRGSASVAPGADPQLDLSLLAADLGRLGRAARALGLDAPALQGRATARLVATGSGPERRLSATVSAPDLTVAGRRLRGVEARGALDASRASARLDAVTRDGPAAFVLSARRAGEGRRLETLALRWGGLSWELARPALVRRARGRVVVDDLALNGPGAPRLALDVPDPSGPARPRSPVRARLRFQDLPLAVAGALAGRALPAGTADGELDLAGTRAAPRLRARLAFDAQRAGRWPASQGRAEVVVAGREARAEGWWLMPGAGAAVIEASVRNGRRSLLSGAGLAAATGRATVDVPALDLSAAARAGLLPQGSFGTASARLELTGSPLDPALSGEISLRNVLVPRDGVSRLPPLSATVDLRTRARSLAVRARAEAPGLPPLRASVEVQARPAQLLSDPAATAADARVEMDPGPLYLASPPLHADRASARATLRGTLRRWTGELEAEARGLLAQGAPAGDLRLRARATAREWSATLSGTPPGGGRLEARLESGRAPGAPWRARVDAERARLDFLGSLAPALSLRNAVLDANLEASGAGAGRTASGRLALTADALDVGSVGAFRDVDAALRADGTALQVERLAASSRGGRATVAGEVSWGETPRVDLRVDARAFPVPLPASPLGQLTTRIAVELALSGPRVEGSVELSPGELRLPDGSVSRELAPLGLPEDIRVHRPGESTGAQPWWRRWLAAHGARVTMQVPAGFWLRSDSANLELNARLTGLWDGERTALRGRLEATRGDLYFFQRRFEVRQLALAFAGRDVADPGLEGLLVLQEPDVTVEASLSGTVKRPELTFSSDPPMDTDRIALLVASGAPLAPGGAAGPGLPSAAISGALSWLAGRFTSALTEALPLDVFAFELGPTGDVQRIQAGAYLTPELFVTFVRNLFVVADENVNEVRAQYRLGRQVSLRLYFGDRDVGGLSLLWEGRFRSAEQRRAPAPRRRRDAPAPGPGGTAG